MSAYAEGAGEEWSSEALARRMEVEEASGSGGGESFPAVTAETPSIPIAPAAKATTTTAPTATTEPLFKVGTAMVTERELPVAQRINTLLRCPVSEFPDACPVDMALISSKK